MFTVDFTTKRDNKHAIFEEETSKEAVQNIYYCVECIQRTETIREW